MNGSFKYILFYKPYNVLCQFTPEGDHQTLKDYIDIKDVYPVGRLDMDSEGLLLLTDDNALKHRLTEPKFNSEKTYVVQVEGIPTEEALAKLRQGVIIKGEKTKPAKVKLLTEEPDFPPREIPIRFRKNIPVSWLEIKLTEGKNRQIRKMTAAVGFPTLRLVRTKIKFLSLDSVEKGKFRFLTAEEIRKLKNNKS